MMILAGLLSFVKEDKRNLVILCLIVVAVLLRCVILLLDWETLLMFIPDDSFYYFQLASNIVSGHGSSMDGVHLTNGYHPLWPIMITPFFLFKPIDPIIPVKISLFFSSMLTILTAFIFYKTVKLITNSKTVSILSFGLYIFNYYVLLVESMGEPAAISNMLLVILLYYTVQYALGVPYKLKQAITYGLIGGFAMLARTDNALYYGMFMLLGLFWFKPFKLSNYIIACVISFVVLLPWFMWNLITFGTIVQTSAVACPYIHHINAERSVLDLLLSFDTKTWLEFLCKSHGIIRYSYITYVFYGVILCGLFITRSKDKTQRRSMGIVLSGVFVTFVLFTLHYAVAMYYREWHVAAAAPFILLLFVLTIRYLVSILPKVSFIWILFGVYYFTVSTIMIVRLPNRPLYYWQTDTLDAKDWVLSKPKGTVAIYDGGIMQYLTNGWLLSIDGNVNNSAQQAVVDACVMDYLKENGVQYLVGWEWIIKRYNKFWPHPAEVSFQRLSMPPTRGYLYMLRMSELNPEVYMTGPFCFWEISTTK